MNDMDENTKNNEFINHLGLEMIEESSKYAKGRIPVKEELLNPFGTMHGGVLYSTNDKEEGKWQDLRISWPE